jgi:hypothetical protein
MANQGPRRHPNCCTSAMCGRLDCAGCAQLPQLVAFQRWVAETGAVVRDHIWSPLWYYPTREKKENKP